MSNTKNHVLALHHLASGQSKVDIMVKVTVNFQGHLSGPKQSI